MPTTSEHITIPLWAQKIVTRGGYMERYYHHKAAGMTNREAWEKTETELHTYFNSNRYSSIHSFENSKSKWVKIQLSKK